PLGTARDSSFTATNISDQPLTIDQIAAVAPDEFTIISPTLLPLTMQPKVPVTIQVHFAPRDTVGIRRAIVLFRSGGSVDSSFGLTGVGVSGSLRSEASLIDFGTRKPGLDVDTAVVLLNDVAGSISNPAF